MSTRNLLDLEQELAEQNAKREKLNLEAAQRRATEQAERLSKAAEEIEQRTMSAKATQEHWEKRKREEEEAEQLRLQKEHEERIKLELEHNAEQERIEEARRKEEQLAVDLENAKFLEEQAQKALEAQIVVVPETSESTYDDSHILTGEAAKGTDGLETGPEMSDHLKRILRLK